MAGPGCGGAHPDAWRVDVFQGGISNPSSGPVEACSVRAGTPARLLTCTPTWCGVPGPAPADRKLNVAHSFTPGNEGPASQREGAQHSAQRNLGHTKKASHPHWPEGHGDQRKAAPRSANVGTEPRAGRPGWNPHPRQSRLPTQAGPPKRTHIHICCTKTHKVQMCTLYMPVKRTWSTYDMFILGGLRCEHATHSQHTSTHGDTRTVYMRPM